MASAPAVLAVELFCGGLLALQAGSIGLVLYRLKHVGRRVSTGALPPVTLLRPVCGIENNIEETLASGFALDHPVYEIIFCVASADDPVVPLVEGLILAHPRVPARLLIGDDVISGNPKLNNLAKGWEAARHDWIAMTDSNVELPRDYFAILFAHWTSGTGLVSSPPAGIRPVGFWAELECAFLDTYQARWQLAADQLGLGFAQGKTLFWRRDILDKAGGLAALGTEMAEDLAATKLVRRAGLKVRLVRRPFAQPLGARTFAEVWRRQLRWSQVRRMGFAGYFAAEVLTGAFLPLARGAVAGGDRRSRRRRCWSRSASPGISSSSGLPGQQDGRRRCGQFWPGRCATCSCRRSGPRAGPAVGSSGAAIAWRSARRRAGTAPTEIRRDADPRCCAPAPADPWAAAAVSPGDGGGPDRHSARGVSRPIRAT